MITKPTHAGMLVNLCLGAAAALLVAGCASTRDAYTYRHDIVAPIIASAAGAGQAAARVVPPVLSLEAARALALDNPSLEAARARVHAARARVMQALSAYLPVASVSTGYNHIYDFHFAQLEGIPGIPRSFEIYSTTLEGSWVLFDGFVREFSAKAARMAREESTAAYLDAVRLVGGEVERTYYEAQSALEACKIAEADAAFNAQLHDATRAMQEQGRATRTDVNTFELRLKAAQGGVVSARTLLAVHHVILEELLALPAGTLGGAVALEPLGPEDASLFEDPDEAAWIARAERARPDLAALACAAVRADAQVHAAAGAWVPQVVLQGRYGWEKVGDMRYRSDHVNSSLVVALAWEFFSGGRTAAAVREAAWQRGEIEALLRARRATVLSEVRRARAAVLDAREKVRLESRVAELAAAVRDDVNQEYRGGKASITRLNEAQRDLVQAQSRHVKARIRLRQAWSELRAAAAEPRGAADQPSQ